MDDRDANTGKSGPTQSTTKIWTAVQHGSGLVGALGLFVAISAYSTDPDSAVVSVGLIVTVAGLIGFIGGRAAARRYHR